jgi:hypothetical protein
MPVSFVKDNKAFEKWLASQCEIVRPDIEYKHHRMEKNAFIFLRATYFRWARKIGDWCPELMDAPQVRAVGDLHVENFGTWRDRDGRLVWGVNDFDEAAEMPYVLDIVRLVTSIQLAPDRPRAINNKAAANAVVRGYRDGLEKPHAALLFEGQTWLRPYAEPGKNKPAKFWKEVKKYKKATPPPAIRKALTRSLPGNVDSIRMCKRRKGGGSLGRQRFVAVAFWRGGQILREAKALVPSAWVWANGRGGTQKPAFLKLANGRYRAPDPFLKIKNKFIIRRIAADSEKIDLGDDAGAKLQVRFLRAMGYDLASIHVDRPGSLDKIKADLARRPRGWLNAAAAVAAAKVREDYREWRRYRKKHR